MKHSDCPLPYSAHLHTQARAVSIQGVDSLKRGQLHSNELPRALIDSKTLLNRGQLDSKIIMEEQFLNTIFFYFRIQNLYTHTHTHTHTLTHTHTHTHYTHTHTHTHTHSHTHSHSHTHTTLTHTLTLTNLNII